MSKLRPGDYETIPPGPTAAAAEALYAASAQRLATATMASLAAADDFELPGGGRLKPRGVSSDSFERRVVKETLRTSGITGGGSRTRKTSRYNSNSPGGAWGNAAPAPKRRAAKSAATAAAPPPKKKIAKAIAVEKVVLATNIDPTGVGRGGHNAKPKKPIEQHKNRWVKTYYVCPAPECRWSGSSRTRHTKSRAKCKQVPHSFQYTPGSDLRALVRDYMASLAHADAAVTLHGTVMGVPEPPPPTN